jgi:acyl-coenzyme A synthetase/AMP-(fatty) acid ligase
VGLLATDAPAAGSSELAPAAPHPGSIGWDHLASFPDGPLDRAESSDGDLAFILYTSGSTGRPKGVCISHRNALAFIDWAAGTVGLTATDRLSNHAPFHFDLSVFDIYGAFRSGAAVCIVPEGASFAPRSLVEFLSRRAITVWYSVPSALVLMAEHGGLLDLAPGPLHTLLFAGEVFPLKHLKRLRRHWPAVRFLNLFGPTETNVCTFFEVCEIAEDRVQPVSIGRACCGDRVWARRSDGTEARVGEEGELMVEGPTVMLGYWGGRPQDGMPYATGDLVRLEDSGDYVYVGRRDDMIKVRGHRVEPGEVEAALLAHPDVRDAAVVVTGSGPEARLVAFLVSAGGGRGPLLAMKEHCARRLPRAMIPDDVRYLNELPRTGNGKIDRKALAAKAASWSEK